MPVQSLPARGCVFTPAAAAIIAAFFAVAPIAALRSQVSTVSERGHTTPVPSTRAVRRTGPIVLDGKLDDEGWRNVEAVTEFKQIDPHEGQPASQRTEVRIVFDEEALYVAARMFDSLGARGVTTRLVRRDADMQSDWFHVVIDSYHDHLGRAFFQVNPSGVKFDALGVGASNPDPAWDPIWETAAQIDSLGWTAEMRIPFSQLRFSRSPTQTWGFQIRRFIQRTQEQDQWSFWTKTEPGGPPRFGHLEGVTIGGSPQHLEVMPYAVARSKHVRPALSGDPFNNGSVQDAHVGADAKYLLTSNLTLDATINPDFGQVEVDPAVVNLSDFETFFDEKRPFFIEGAGIFGFGSFNCMFCSNVSSLESFYSRRIGRAPTGADLAYDAGKYADVPTASTILGAAKITGRTSNGFTVGLLDATTNRMTARVMDASGRRFNETVEPLTNFFVGRVKRDYLHGNLVIGAIGTSVVRALDSTFESRLNRHSEMVGTDIRYTWDNQRYSLIASGAVSSISGDSLAVLRAQRSSAHYFQRPDRGERHGGFFSSRFDSSATSLQGMGAYARIAKDGGNWLWEAMVNTRSAGWEVNDISFLRRSDYHWENGNIARSWTVPTKWYRSMFAILGGQQEHNLDGDLTGRQFHGYWNYQSLGYWFWNAMVIVRPATFDDRLLRGGPVAKQPQMTFYSANVSTDSRRALQLNVSPSISSDEQGGNGRSLGVNATWKAASNLTVTFGPGFDASTSKQQFVTSVSDPTALSFFGRRYVLSSIRQRTLSLDTRVSATFTPTMTLEMYVQPFIASGHYFDYKELRSPRTLQSAVFGRDRGTITSIKDVHGIDSVFVVDPDATGPAASFDFDNPDFNSRSLRGNAVFRWEYRPGSTLYLVWTQSRSNSAPVGDFDIYRDRSALFSAHPDNIFLVKLSYWLGS